MSTLTKNTLGDGDSKKGRLAGFFWLASEWLM